MVDNEVKVNIVYNNDLLSMAKAKAEAEAEIKTRAAVMERTSGGRTSYSDNLTGLRSVIREQQQATNRLNREQQQADNTRISNILRNLSYEFKQRQQQQKDIAAEEARLNKNLAAEEARQQKDLAAEKKKDAAELEKIRLDGLRREEQERKRIINAEKAAIKEQEDRARRIVDLKRNGVEQTFGALGGYQYMRFAKAYDSFSAANKAEGGSGGVGGTLGTALGAGMEAGPLLLVVAAAKGVEAVFNMLKEQAKQVGNAFDQIGGHKELEGQIIEAAGRQLTAVQLSSGSTASPEEIVNSIRYMNTNVGTSNESNTEQVKSFLAAGGDIKNMPALTLAQAGGLGIEGAGTVAGKYQQRFNASAAQTALFIEQANMFREQGLDVFKNPGILDKMERGGAPMNEKLGLLAAVARGEGGTLKTDVKDIYKYQDTHSSSSLASDIFNGKDNQPGMIGALRADFENKGGNIKDKAAIQSYVNNLGNVSGAVSKFNAAVDKFANTVSARSTLTENQINDTVEGTVSPGIANIREYHKKGNAQMRAYKAKAGEIAEAVWESTTGELADLFSHILPTLSTPTTKAEPTNNEGDAKNAILHTSDNTTKVVKNTQDAATTLKRMLEVISNGGFGNGPHRTVTP
jgi:hypothetical protein